MDTNELLFRYNLRKDPNINASDLVKEIESLLDMATNYKTEFQDVNWGDLGIRDITYQLSMIYPQDGPYYTVKIEEVSPDSNFRQWIQDKLDETGRFPHTFIELDW